MFTELKKFSTSLKRTWLYFASAAILSLPATTFANEQFSPSELDTLVSTIALYPDPLLVQVLAASVHGDEIPGASDWANQHRNLNGKDLAERIKLEELPYDESVQALIPFPTVLATMAKYQVWTYFRFRRLRCPQLKSARKYHRQRPASLHKIHCNS